MPLLNPEEITVAALMADLPMQRNAQHQLELQLLTLKEGLELQDNPLNQRQQNLHIVQEAETLPILSVRFYGKPDYWLELARVNGIEYPYTVWPGQQLKIPEIAGHS